MAAPTTTNEVTVRRLSDVITGTWGKIKDALGLKANKEDSVYYVAGPNTFTAYSASSTYTVWSSGAYTSSNSCVYSGRAYYCKTAITTPEAWTSSHWTLIPTVEWTGSITGLTAYYTGLKIAYKIPNVTGGNSSTTLNINGLGAKTVYRDTSNTTTHLPAGSVVFLAYDGSAFRWADYDANSTYSGMITAYLNNAGDAAKTATSTNFKLTSGVTILLTNNAANTKAAALTLNVNSTGAKTLYINGAASSSTNYTIPVGTYFCHYDGSYWQLWTDGTAHFKQLKLTNKLTDANISSAATWNAKQDALATQTAYSAKGSATKVPQITTNTLGQVTGITEVTISGVTPASHTHGNIQNGGTLQTNDVTIASGDKLVVTDSSDSSKIARASVSFDGSTTTTALTPKGTFESFAKAADITSAIQALDVSSVGGAGKYISAISETDGKISATATSMDTTPTGSSTNAVTSGGVKTSLDGKKNFKYAKVYAVTAYNASSARYFLLAERETTYTGNWQDTSEFKLTAYTGVTPKYMTFRLKFSGSKTTCGTPEVCELYSGNLDSNERKVIEVRYTTSVVASTSITVHTYIYIDRSYLQTQWTSFQLEPLSMGTGDRSNNIDNGLTCWSYKTAETYVTSLSGTTVAHSSEPILVDISGNAATATSATNATNLYNQGNSNSTKYPVFFDGTGTGNKSAYTIPNLTAYYDTGNGVIWIVGASGGEKTNARRGSVRIGNGAYVGKIWSDNLTANRDYQLPDEGGTFAVQGGTYSLMTVGNATNATNANIGSVTSGKVYNIAGANGTGNQPLKGDSKIAYKYSSGDTWIKVEDSSYKAYLNVAENKAGIYTSVSGTGGFLCYQDSTGNYFKGTADSATLADHATYADALPSRAVGNPTTPVYIKSDGTPDTCTSLTLNTTGSAASISVTAVVGSSDRPVYFSSAGKPVMVSRCSWDDWGCPRFKIVKKSSAVTIGVADCANLGDVVVVYNTGTSSFQVTYPFGDGTTAGTNTAPVGPKTCRAFRVVIASGTAGAMYPDY